MIDFGLILLIFSLGLWFGWIMLYFLLYRPLTQKFESLQEEMHQQIKIGFYNQEDNSYE